MNVMGSFVTSFLRMIYVTMQPRIRAQKMKSIFAILIGVVALLVLIKIAVASGNFVKNTGLSPGTVIRLLVNHGATLSSSDGRTNILVLGIGGGTHEGADLTDTMLVLSLAWKTRTMALISVPRDIWSDTLKDKINSAYHYGEEKKKGGGMILAKAEVEDVIGIPVHYALVFDFSGFKKVIDLVGGVTIDIPQAFTDTEFPIEGRENNLCNGDPQYRCRYQTVHFDSGIQTMDGERSLMYVRSRHAEGNEGGDFARSRRQQDVLIALKQKFTSPFLWLSPARDITLIHALDDATDTDTNLGEFLTVGKFMAQIPSRSIGKIAIDDLLLTPPDWVYGRYVLVPKVDFDTIHVYIKNQLKK